jgi:glycosidase
MYNFLKSASVSYQRKPFNFIILIIAALIGGSCAGISQTSNSSVTHPEWSYNKTIYEVNIRQYSEEGTFKAFEEHLPRLQEMGIGILWFMPIHPIGVVNRKGNLGSYYSVKDYLAVNPEFGTINEFKELVKKAHSMGMYVILDWVANHTAWDNNLTLEYPEWFTKDNEGNFVPPVDDWSDVIDLNYDNRELWNYMIDALKFWIEECDIDGYRCDVAEMVPLDFWVEARKELEKIKPVFMLAEAENPQLHHEAFDMTYTWTLFNLMHSIAQGRDLADELNNFFDKEKRLYPSSAFRMRFTTNHDENSWKGTVDELFGDAAESFAVFTFIVPGMPLIYSGQEAGLNKRLKFFEKDPIVWIDHKYSELYKKLVHLKLNSEVLLNGERGGEMKIIQTNNENIFAFIRQTDDEKILSVFNFSPLSRQVILSDNSLSGNYIDYFSGDHISIEQTHQMSLQPWGYKILILE